MDDDKEKQLKPFGEKNLLEKKRSLMKNLPVKKRSLMKYQSDSTGKENQDNEEISSSPDSVLVEQEGEDDIQAGAHESAIKENDLRHSSASDLTAMEELCSSENGILKDVDINDAVEGLLMLANSFINKDDETEYNSIKRKITDSTEEFPAAHTMYTCNICNKSFSDYRALGGHKSSHKKIKIEDQGINKVDGSETTGVAEASTLTMAETGGGGGGAATSSSINPLPLPLPNNHRCKKCGKAFPTGQALGGHMRLHYTGG